MAIKGFRQEYKYNTGAVHILLRRGASLYGNRSSIAAIGYKVLSSIFHLKSYGNYIISTFSFSAPVVASIPLSSRRESLALREASLSFSKALFSFSV